MGPFGDSSFGGGLAGIQLSNIEGRNKLPQYIYSMKAAEMRAARRGKWSVMSGLAVVNGV